MNLPDAFAWLEASALATAIRESGFLFPCIEATHVLALVIVVGSIAIVDLRLLGIASTNRSTAALTAEILPLTWTAFLVAAITGGLLFISHAVDYASNLQFRVKMVLLILAGINMLCFHRVVDRTKLAWHEAEATPWPGKLAGAASLLLWIGIVAFGRWIGFSGIQ